MTDKVKKRDKNFTASQSFHLEADKSRSGMSVSINGIIGIADFTDETVFLRSHGGKVIVSGKRLNVSVYENKTVEISGRVEEISFKYGKN